MVPCKGFVFNLMCIGLCLKQVLCFENSPATLADLSFVAEPSDVMTQRDKPVTLDCALSGGSAKKLQLEYNWFRNGHQLTLNNKRKLLSNGSLLMEGRQEEGMYNCLVIMAGIGAIVSRRAELKLAPPDRPGHVSGRDVHEMENYLGDTAMLPCTNATDQPGRRKPPVEWLKDDVEVDLSNPNVVVHQEEGGLLEIVSLQFQDFSRYKCRSTSGDGMSVWWSEVNLSQSTDISAYKGHGPRFVARPRDVAGVEGGVVVLVCAANGRDRFERKAKIVWLKDGITIDFNSDSHFSLIGEGNLRMDGLMEEDGGQYTCRASNFEDSIDVDVTLTVQVPPKIRVRPRNVATSAHTDCLLACDIYANPRPAVKWTKNGLPLVTDDYVEMVDGFNLRILGVQPSDQGVYQCIADSPIGNIQAAAFLFVNQDDERSHATSADLPVPSALAASITFMRSATLSWRLPDSVVNFEKVVGYLVSWDQEPSDRSNTRTRVLNVTSLEANLQFLKPSTSYKVKVVSYDADGFISEPAVGHFVTQDEAQVPDPPSNFQVAVLSPTSVRLTWEDSKSSPSVNRSTSGFKIFYFDVADGSTEGDLTVTGLTHELTLKKFRTYSFRVAAFNSNGQSSSSDEITIRTHSDVPTSAPQNASLETLSSTSILVRWEPPPEESRNGIITGYRIRFKAAKDKASPVGIATTDGVQVFHSLTDLNKGTEYMIRVQAQTRNGAGPLSPWLHAQTLTHDLDETVVPGPPTSLRARPLTNSILISWTPPVNQDVMVRGYVVAYGVGAPHAIRQILDAKQRYHTIKGLQASSNYIMTLKAYNAVGEGPPVYESAVTRDEQALEPSMPITPPVGLQAIVLSSSTIVLTWTDTGLGKNQRVNDNRYYIIKCTPRYQQPSSKVRPKYVNSTLLNAHVDKLKADTEYEFSVRIVKGKRQSVYSLSIFNRTKEASPATAPRDVTPTSVDSRPTWVSLSWQPPRQSNGQINGYLVYYTTDSSLSDVDWVVEAIMGERLTTTIKDLSLETTYYFKVQARNNIGYGPMSPKVVFRTPTYDIAGASALDDDFGRSKHSGGGRNAQSPPLVQPSTAFNVPANVLWIAVGCLSVLAVVILSIVGVVVCRKKSHMKAEVNRNGYIPANKDKPTEGSSLNSRSRELKPPDLWTHGRNLEMKVADPGSSGDPDELTEMMSRNTSSVDEDGGSDMERYRCVNPRSKLMPLESHALREPYLISNGHLTSTMSRPNYPRTQYSAQQQQQLPLSSTPRVNVGLVSPSLAGDQLVVDRYADKQDFISPGFNAPSRLAQSITNKSPPPMIAPPIHPLSSSSSTSSKCHASAINHDVTSDTKSFTTEELCAEMANLEGLMKDLSAITQQEFHC